jgi:hypothetical protein
MDRIVVQVNQDNNKQVHRLVLQEDATSTSPFLNVTLLIAEGPQPLRDAYAAFLEQAEAYFEQATATVEDWAAIVAISPDPQDPTISRKVFVKVPVQGTENNVSIFSMPALVRHFTNGGKRLRHLDFVEPMRGLDNRMIVIDGVEVSEYQHFKNLALLYPMPTIMQQQILAEDAKGRFNRSAPMVPAQPIDGSEGNPGEGA